MMFEHILNLILSDRALQATLLKIGHVKRIRQCKIPEVTTVEMV
jgi:hypothetical protein